MYCKQIIGEIPVRKMTESEQWVKWVHHSDGITHCDECLNLDGRWFHKNNAPRYPHHIFCHCVLESLDYGLVLQYATAHSDYSKYDPYLFNTTGNYNHNKEKMFYAWGYTSADAEWLKAEVEKQALDKYIAGDYLLGKLNDKGQRISIRITITRRDSLKPVSFLTGWMVYPDGKIVLTTPYGGK